MMSNDTVFGKIIRGELQAERLYEDKEILAFRDINAVAPSHVLVIPKRAIANAAAAQEEDGPLLGRLILVANEVARREGLDETGYRLVVNVGRDGGESVPHLHVHVIGGRSMGWPPG
jgi:histidine triad (HIT) family protein